MRRLNRWFREHPTTGDSLLAAALFLPQVLGWFSGFSVRSRPAEVPEYLVLSALLVAPLVVRRRWPVAGAAATLVALALLVLLQSPWPLRVAQLAACVYLHTLVVRVGRGVAAGYAGVIGAGVGIELARADHEPILKVWVALFFLLLAVVSWVLGELAVARRAEVAQRVHALKVERDHQARIAVAEERNRIAREIHDVLAHSVSVMVSQADGARYALRGKPELAEQALRTIGSTGRETLTELRQLLGVLRADTDREDAPQPTATAVPDLVERVRALGSPVSLEVVGDLGALPTGPGLGVYRIVQESLTNALKHGAGGIAVRLEHDGAAVTIDVRNLIGPGTAPVPGGNGVIGMRERATAYGGELAAGPEPDGDWRVRAVVPVGV